MIRMKTTYLSVTGTQTYTLSTRPMRLVPTGETNADDNTLTIYFVRRAWWDYYPELIWWHVWKRWRRVRIRVGRV